MFTPIQTSTVAGGILAPLTVHSPRGFELHSVFVDNNSSQWLQVVGTLRFISPYTIGVIIALNGAGSVTIGIGAPANVEQQAVVSGEQYSAYGSDTPFPSNPGVSTQTQNPIQAIAGGVFNGLHSAQSVTGTSIRTHDGLTFIIVRNTIIKADSGNTANIYIAQDAQPLVGQLVLPLGKSEGVALNGSGFRIGADNDVDKAWVTLLA